MTLAHRTFINTRPAHQAESLNHLLDALGAKIINFPTLEIETINAAHIKSLCKHLDAYDIAIFVSANAVYCSQPYWPFPIATVIAIGSGTEKALRNHGIANIILPHHFSSEGILALPELNSTQAKKIILFSGKDPKPLLHETLSKKGAKVTLCECYRRTCPKPNKETMALFDNPTFDGIISTSPEGLNNLNILLKNHSNIKKVPLIVISPTMEKLAKSKGWQQVVLAPNASNEAIIDTLIAGFGC